MAIAWPLDIAWTMGWPSSFSHRCWKIPLCLARSWLTKSCHDCCSVTGVLICPCLKVGIRYVAEVVIVTLLQSAGSWVVSLLVLAQYFWCQLVYPLHLPWICHCPFQWYSFCVEYDVSQCHQCIAWSGVVVIPLVVGSIIRDDWLERLAIVPIAIGSNLFWWSSLIGPVVPGCKHLVGLASPHCW